jgi:putative addiction module CopG family antidote
MNINFPSVDETYIRQKVDAGFYSNATELVRDAVRAHAGGRRAAAGC